jgi:hypothetical protein
MATSSSLFEFCWIACWGVMRADVDEDLAGMIGVIDVKMR